MNRLDLLVFGATGFTGKFVVREVMKLAKEKGNLKWGIAGRNEKKLRALLQNLSDKTGEDTRNVPVVIANVSDEKSLHEMASKTRVLLNCCGPYLLYGEPTVKACIENGTHQVDICGEVEYMKKIREDYNKAVEEKGVYIVSACALGSLPADLGVIHLIENFGGEVNSVEEYLTLEIPPNSKSSTAHYATWESHVYDTSQMSLCSLLEKLNPKQPPGFVPELKKRPFLHKSDIVNSWCLPLPGTDQPIVEWSQQFLYETEKQHPVQFRTYFGFKSLWVTFQAIIMTTLFMLMCMTSFTKKLLLKYPEVFSLGFASHKEPSEEHLNKMTFSMTFYGEGWTEHGSSPKENNILPNKAIITKVSGRDPGYGFTATALVLSAITILQEADKMPGKGGILLPGAAFSKTSLRQELMSHGMKFEVISTKFMS